MVYGGRWEYDENAAVHATALDPSTLDPRDVMVAVPVPSRRTDFSVKLDQLATANHTLSVGYDQSKGSFRNQGLDSGFDLPERAYDTTSEDQSARASLTSIFLGAVNELRVQFSRSEATAEARESTPAVLVLDAFHAGGNQAALSQREVLDQLEIGQDLTWAWGSHTLKAGVQATRSRIRNDDRSNFGGEFTFGAGLERDGSWQSSA